MLLSVFPVVLTLLNRNDGIDPLNSVDMNLAHCVSTSLCDICHTDLSQGRKLDNIWVPYRDLDGQIFLFGVSEVHTKHIKYNPRRKRIMFIPIMNQKMILPVMIPLSGGFLSSLAK